MCFKPKSQKNVPANNYHLKVVMTYMYMCIRLPTCRDVHIYTSECTHVLMWYIDEYIIHSRLCNVYVALVTCKDILIMVALPQCKILRDYIL